MTLTQFLDNFWAKIFNKPWGGLKIKVSIFMVLFEGINHPLWVGPALSVWWKTFLGGEFCLDGVAPPWILAGIPKKGFLPPIDDKAHKIEGGPWL